MENLNVSLKEFYGNELSILQGKALEQKEPKIVHIEGDIKSISSFLKLRKGLEVEDNRQAIRLEKSVVIVNKQGLSMRLYIDPEEHYGASVTGRLEISDELKEFAINTTTTFSQNELVKKIRFNRMAFANTDKHAALLAAYQSFKASSHVEVESSKDNRGNKVQNFDRKITTGLSEEFILNIPIFKGQEKKTFRVEICLDVTDGSVRFWFESVELHELMQIETDRIFGEELKACEGLVIINQ